MPGKFASVNGFIVTIKRKTLFIRRATCKKNSEIVKNEVNTFIFFFLIIPRRVFW